MKNTDNNQATLDTAGMSGDVGSFPALMTEAELIAFLRIPEVSKAQNHHHAVEHLKRMRGLPCIHICKQPLYPQSAVREWIQREVKKEMGR